MTFRTRPHWCLLPGVDGTAVEEKRLIEVSLCGWGVQWPWVDFAVAQLRALKEAVTAISIGMAREVERVLISSRHRIAKIQEIASIDITHHNFYSIFELIFISLR